MAADRERQSPSSVDDETVALVLRLHREPKASGSRRNAREIVSDCRKAGRTISRDKVSQLIKEAHSETIGAATSDVRERIAKTLDLNVERISKMSDLLATVAVTGMFPKAAIDVSDDVDPDEMAAAILAARIANPAQRVAAAREAINGSSQLLSAVGVNQPGEDGAGDIVSRIRQIYNYDVADAEKAEREDESVSVGDEAGALSTTLAH